MNALIILTLLVGIQLCGARMTGAPIDACVTMVPQHRNYVPQKSAAPFTVTVPNTVTSYTAAQSITVTIQQKAPSSLKIKGFLLEARRVNFQLNVDEPIGTWTAAANTQTVTCTAANDALTHKSPLNLATITGAWTAPTPTQDQIVFKATIVTNFNTFWTDVTSKVITTSGAQPLPNPTFAPFNPIAQIKTLGECGLTKGCFMQPSNCVESDCEYLVTYRETPDKTAIDFEMSAKTTGYVAVGFSKDQLMGDDSVIQCAFVSSNSRVVISNSYNEKNLKANRPIPVPYKQGGLTGMQGYYNNGRLSCRFRRNKVVTGGPSAQLFAIDKPYYLFVARGAVTPDGYLVKHNTSPGMYPLISPKKVDMVGNNMLYSYVPVRNNLVKAHGCMMIVAWILFVSFAMLMAHYYKPMWPNESLYKERVWFQVHRACMIVAVILIILAFILILIHARGYSNLRGLPYAAHPILGFIIVALVIINPLITLCRCKPEDDDRPIFNWIHWGIGTVAHILAVINIFIGMDLEAAAVLWFCSWILVAWVIFHAVVQITLEIHQCCMRRRDKEKMHDYELEKTKTVQTYPYRRPEPAGRGFKICMLSIYGVITACVVLAMVLIIAMYP
ncbi:ferric-chelate reductase 1-like [Tubulanus polymorphus]|uniref:ferric-chelate reductase 1-like n=1 Tax=Tubulanus polymorphus TaxID=672921 RepID=UPI003DA63404